MPPFFRRADPSNGVVFFRGSAAHRSEEYGFLRAKGVSVAPGPARGDAHWTLELSHARWGPATLTAFRDPGLPAARDLRFVRGLEGRARDEILSAGWAIGVSNPATEGNVLLDRKNFLRYLRAVMGDDGLAGFDNGAHRFWTREGLDDELQHEAELDAMSLCTFHAVFAEQDAGGPIPWLHSHGLEELGAHDFDILNAHPSINTPSAAHVIRSLAFQSLEGVLVPGAEAHLLRGAPPVRAVPAAEFQRSADPGFAELRDHSGEHAGRRVVLCDARPGLAARVLSRWRPSPARVFMEDLDARVYFSSASATQLLRRRALATLGLMGALLEEFGPLGVVGLVKAACPTSSGGHENPWFIVREVRGDSLVGVLDNDPHDIPEMRKGGSYTLPTDRVVDWLIFTRVGEINPRDFSAARGLREDPGGEA